MDGTASDEHSQHRAPFFEALLAYRDAGIVPYSTPGHKLGHGAAAELVEAFGTQALALDIPHGGGVDDTHRTHAVIRDAEALAASAWGADDAAFLVNGSSTGNIAFLLSTCKPGDTVLVARNLHTSLLSGLILSGARPIYLQPGIHPDLNLTLDVPPRAVKHALREHPDARAVVLVSPAYTGVSSNLSEIAATCRQNGVMLFVDEAWGPHFPFHPDLPAGAVQSGASGGVTSIHKLLAGLTQASLMTFSGPLLDRERVAPSISLIETTSPSATILASIDVARRQMALHGRVLLDRSIDLAWRARQAIDQVRGISVIGSDVIEQRPGAGFDPTRIMIDVQGTGLNGFQAEEFLRTVARVGVEMSDLTGVIVHITIGDTPESVDHLIRGLRLLGEHQERGPHAQPGYLRSSGAIVLSSRSVMTPREAALGPSRTVKLDEATGSVSAEIITPYPPGIPVVAPGDVFSQECVEYLQAGRASGMYVSGPADSDLETVRIVDG